MVVRATAIWLLLLIVAFACGTLRAYAFEPAFGKQAAHVIGTLIVVAIFVCIIFAAVRWLDPHLRTRRLVAIGAAWTAATVAFEFGFGLYVAGHSWNRLFADYNLARGRLWLLVLAAILLTPVAAGAARRRLTPFKR